LILIVICGGGSVMFESPFAIDLEKLIAVNKTLLESGANILEMNTIRKHLSSIKGGGLVKKLNPAKVIGLVFSDVIGNDLSFIASGPTVKDETTIANALEIYDKYDLNLHLEKTDFCETPKEDNLFENTENILMLSNSTALEAMQKKAKNLEIKANIFSDKFSSDALTAFETLIQNVDSSSILLAGGETTLKVNHPEGKGGRNQASILAYLLKLDTKTIIASFDTDGWDNSIAAGAIADVSSLDKAKAKGLHPQEFLQQNNSLVFFKNIGDAIITDKLPSNVSDLFIIYKYE
jgi:glycerate-2-kinase